jgi:hypothetical protein
MWVLILDWATAKYQRDISPNLKVQKSNVYNTFCYMLEALRYSQSGHFELTSLDRVQIKRMISHIAYIDQDTARRVSALVKSIRHPKLEIIFPKTSTKIFDRQDVFQIVVRRLSMEIQNDPTVKDRKQEWVMKYRASENGFSKKAYQEACYGLGSLVIIGRTEVKAELGYGVNLMQQKHDGTRAFRSLHFRAMGSRDDLL